MAEWHGTKFPGVRYREHPERKHGIRKDQYFAVRYQKDGERREEGLGWLSEGWTAQKAYDKLADLKRTGKTLQEEREEARAARRHAKAEEERIRLESITFSEFWHKTYFPQVHADKKPKTAQSEEQFFRLWIEPVLGDKTFLNIAPIHLEQIKRNMSAAGKSPRTIQYCLAVVRQVFNLARIRRVFRGTNPVSDVKKPSVDNRRMRFLTHEEAEVLMAELKRRSLQLHDIALLSLHCGLRAGEIFNLEWQDVNFGQGQVHVAQLFIRDPKNKHNRYAHMTSAVRRMLEHRQESTGPVFKTKTGEKIREVSSAFDKAVSAVGLNEGITDRRQRVVFHTLRHTYASWLVEAGTHLFVVKELMGHQTLAMTERYSHVSDERLKAAVNGLEASIEKSRGKP